MTYKYGRKLLMLGTALSFSALCPSEVQAVDVSNWTELNTNKGQQSILFVNDIQAAGSPSVISLNLASDQTFDGGGYSLTGANGFSFSLNNTAAVTFNNLGSYSAGTSGDNTFSYIDLNDTTQYVKINKSVNSFPKYLITRYQNGVALNINNSAFTNNGGRIVVLSGSNETLNIKNSVFYNNSSDQNVAMISGKGIINIEDSIFVNNANTKNDGGVLDVSASTSIVTVKNSYFINNSGRFGGVINQIAGKLRIEGSRFEGNRSSRDAGAVSLDGNIDMVEYIKDSQFVNNRNGGSYYDGGAISTTGGYIKTMDNVLFEDNVAVSGGGGLWGAMNSKHKAKDPVFFNKVVFKNNEAGSGGGYYSEGNSRQNYTYITDSEFTDNTVKATGHYLSFNFPLGGGMVNTGDVPMVINNTTFSGNKALHDGNNDYSAGGGLYFAGGSADYPLKIVDSTFSNNSAFEGGALFLDNTDAAIVAATKDVVFSGNTADAETDDYNGGADIYFQADSYAGTLSLNADEGKKIVFNGSVAAYSSEETAATIDINKSGVTYNTYDGTTETEVSAGTGGEIVFNAPVGDAENYFENINLHNGTMTVSKDAKLNANVNVLGGTMNIADQAVTAKSVNFSSGSTLSLTIKSDSDYGNLTAENITVEEGATLKATLAQGAVIQGKSVTLQLLSADNQDFNNFTDSFENNMYKFEKAGKNGAYTITQDKTAEDVVKEEGARPWVAEAVKDYVDVGGFEEGTVAADIAGKLTELAQNDAEGLIEAVKTLAPMENAVIQAQAVEDVNRLFKTIDGYLRGERSLYGLSSGDMLEGVRMWARPYFGESKVNDRGKISGIKTHSHGIIAGMERDIASHFKAGIGIQYDETDIDGVKRTTDTDATLGFVYGEYKIGNWFVNSTASYGQSNYHESMYTLGSVFKANYKVYTGSASAVTGYQIKNFTPEIGLRYYNIKRDGYTDSASQEVVKAETDILRATGGVHFIYQYKNLYPDVYVGLTYDIMAGKNNTLVNLANGTSYMVKGKRLSRLGYEFNAGLNAYLRDDLIFGVNYIGAYREKYQEHTAMLRLQYNF